MYAQQHSASKLQLRTRVFPASRESQSFASARAWTYCIAATTVYSHGRSGHDHGVRDVAQFPQPTQTCAALGMIVSNSCSTVGGVNGIPSWNSCTCPGPNISAFRRLRISTMSGCPDGTVPASIRHSLRACWKRNEERSTMDVRIDSCADHASSVWPSCDVFQPRLAFDLFDPGCGACWND